MMVAPGAPLLEHDNLEGYACAVEMSIAARTTNPIMLPLVTGAPPRSIPIVLTRNPFSFWKNSFVFSTESGPADGQTAANWN